MLQKSWIRLWPLDVTLRLSLNLTGDDETNFPHRVLLTDSQVASLRKAFAKRSSAIIKFSKTQVFKIIQPWGFLGRLLRPFTKFGLTFMKNVLRSLAKSVSITLGLTAAASAADTGIYKKILKSGNSGSYTTTLIISRRNEWCNENSKVSRRL